MTEEGVSIERQYRSDATMLGLAGELRQVFSNLLRNALDAIGQTGRIVIRERCWTDLETGEKHVRVTVADSGPGMDAEVRKRLFEPFFSTKPSTGTGLGLWVSQEIVAKHWGYFRVRSSTDPAHHGAVFQVTFPAVPGA